MNKMIVTIDGQEYTVEVSLNPAEPTHYNVLVNGQAADVYVPTLVDPTLLEWVVVDNRPYELVVAPDMSWVRSLGGMHSLEVRAKGVGVTRPASGDGRVKAPIPGLISRLLVAPGAVVEVGQPLLVLEAMKMENEIRAPRSGTVQTVKVQPGQSVALSELMIEIG